MSSGPSRNPPAPRSRMAPNTLGESMRGRHNHSMFPLAAIRAADSVSERKAYSAIGGKADWMLGCRGAVPWTVTPSVFPPLAGRAMRDYDSRTYVRIPREVSHGREAHTRRFSAARALPRRPRRVGRDRVLQGGVRRNRADADGQPRRQD